MYDVWYKLKWIILSTILTLKWLELSYQLSVFCNNQRLECRNSLQSVSIPNSCQSTPSECEANPYVIIADHCEFIDQQYLKLQECPEVVPTGEMPRNITLLGEECTQIVLKVKIFLIITMSYCCSIFFLFFTTITHPFFCYLPSLSQAHCSISEYQFTNCICQIILIRCVPTNLISFFFR